MAKKRPKMLETRKFGFVIGAFVFLILTFLGATTRIFSALNTKTVDLHFALKDLVTATSVQEGVTVKVKNPKISDDIVVIGIDTRSLDRFGKWPFPRSVHANLVDSFTRIKDQKERESALFLDVFFIEPDRNPADDARFVRSIGESDRVFMESVLDIHVGDYESYDRMMARHELLTKRFGTFKAVTGPWSEAAEFYGLQAPLKPYAEKLHGYGHANYTEDSDQTYRRQPLVAKLSKEIEQIRFENLAVGYDVDSSAYERLAWIDEKGLPHTIRTPLTDKSLARLKKDLEADSPPVVVDADGDGVAEESYHVVKKYRDSFIPAITLSLALNYLGVAMDEVTVDFGSRILIPHPTVYDATTDSRVPYSVPLGKDEYDGEGNLVKPAARRTISELSIPIDANGSMIINFMGKRSSSSIDGYQTFPIRSYAGYADRVPGPDPETWPRTKAVGGKILMVGPFADGIAQDEKPTPYGLMYGIEIHANALNTILMDSFLRPVPLAVDLLVLAVLVMAVAFVSSRFSAPWSLATVLVGIIVFFLAVTFIFEYRELIVDFPTPALGMVFTFVAVVSYRAMTEERDKKMIRATFGKYVSPRVVDQILENPPELGGVDKELTVLFSDIRGFTTLSENMTPQELVNHLNEYLTAMTDIILEYGGTLDKYVGDEVMCFWGAPLPQQDHAVLACQCALRQMEKLHELNEHWPPSKRINIGIGLNSGIMTVGNMGSPGRMNYTLMGDNVNLGARLEGTNKQYGTNIIISEFTYGMVKDKFIVRELDNIRVKGKNKPALIYELVASVEPLVPPLPIQERKR